MAKTTLHKQAFTCPACNQPVMMSLSMTTTGEEQIDTSQKTVTVDMKIDGVQVNHDCTSRTTR